MARSIEQILVEQIGNLTMTIASLQAQLEAANDKIIALEKKKNDKNPG
jgi:hypothetical protein